mgnify:CR=1 FL=1
MALVRWQPSNVFGLGNDFNRLFEGFTRDGSVSSPPPASTWKPSVDISETQDEFVVTADLPGINREDLNVTVADGRLTIRGERRQESQAAEGSIHRVERVYGTFTRAFDLPTAVNSENITASYRDGVLSVSVPKAEEAKPKQIEVKISA